MVEAALLAPIFLTLLLGIFEFGLLLRNDLAMGNAIVGGARAGSVASDAREADFLVLRSIAHGIDAWGAENLDHVVVFRATGPDSEVPVTCKSGPVAGLCNHYRAVDFTLPYKLADESLTTFWGCGPAAVDEFWCPSDRPVALSWNEPAGSPYPDGPAYLGVHIQGRHQFATRLFGSSILLSETRVLQLEPRIH